MAFWIHKCAVRSGAAYAYPVYFFTQTHLHQPPANFKNCADVPDVSANFFTGGKGQWVFGIYRRTNLGTAHRASSAHATTSYWGIHLGPDALFWRWKRACCSCFCHPYDAVHLALTESRHGLKWRVNPLFSPESQIFICLFMSFIQVFGRHGYQNWPSHPKSIFWP